MHVNSCAPMLKDRGFCDTEKVASATDAIVAILTVTATAVTGISECENDEAGVEVRCPS